MANRTDPLARSIHGTNPQVCYPQFELAASPTIRLAAVVLPAKLCCLALQNLVEKILRMKIYNSTYWKERCFGLTAETLVDEAVSLKYIGGTFGGARKPTDFMCLVLKLLQIQPDREIVVEFIKNEDYKYVRLLGTCLSAHFWLCQTHSSYYAASCTSHKHKDKSDYRFQR